MSTFIGLRTNKEEKEPKVKKEPKTKTEKK